MQNLSRNNGLNFTPLTISKIEPEININSCTPDDQRDLFCKILAVISIIFAVIFLVAALATLTAAFAIPVTLGVIAGLFFLCAIGLGAVPLHYAIRTKDESKKLDQHTEIIKNYKMDSKTIQTEDETKLKNRLSNFGVPKEEVTKLLQVYQNIKQGANIFETAENSKVPLRLMHRLKAPWIEVVIKELWAIRVALSNDVPKLLEQELEAAILCNEQIDQVYGTETRYIDGMNLNIKYINDKELLFNYYGHVSNFNTVFDTKYNNFLNSKKTQEQS